MRILVTGYGPFGGVTVNPSAVVVHKLEQDMMQQLEEDYDQQIELLTKVIDVDYAGALNCSNWARNELNVDFAIHIGVHPGSGCVFLERRAFRDGYISKDVNGAVPLQNCCELECPAASPDAAAAGADHHQHSPPVSCRYTVLDLERLRTALLDALANQDNADDDDGTTTAVNIAISEDPGRYLCGYIYYCSLLNLAGRSLFVHIPPFDNANASAHITRLIKQLVVEVAKQMSRNTTTTTTETNTAPISPAAAAASSSSPCCTCPCPPPSSSSASASPALTLSSLMINNGITVSFPLAYRNSSSSSS